MGFRIGSLLLLAALTTMFAACGGGGSAQPVDPNAVAIVTVNLSKALALADNTDTVSITATVTKNAGGAVADGAVVTFSVPAGTLSATTATTTGGTTAPITLKCAALTGGPVNQTILVTATAGGVSGTASVKFINQPTSAVVQIALTPSIPNLTALSFGVKNTTGASFASGSETLIGTAQAAGSTFIATGFDPVSNVATTGLINATIDSNGLAIGFATGTAPIIQLTYNIAIGLPTFSIDAGTPIFVVTAALPTPVLNAANFVLTRAFNTE